MPIYVVKTKAEHGPVKTMQARLVRAGNKAQAKNYAADLHITVEQASEDDLINLTKAQVEVEDANATVAPTGTPIP